MLALVRLGTFVGSFIPQLIIMNNTRRRRRRRRRNKAICLVERWAERERLLLLVDATTGWVSINQSIIPHYSHRAKVKSSQVRPGQARPNRCVKTMGKGEEEEYINPFVLIFHSLLRAQLSSRQLREGLTAAEERRSRQAGTYGVMNS